MRIIPDGIKPHNEELVGIGECPHFDVADTIKINLDDFDAWYKATYWRKEGGLIHYTSVSWYIQKWLDSTIFMSTDLEAK